MNNDQNKTHGVLTDAQRKEFIRRTSYISEADRDMRAAFVDEIAAAAAPQSPVAPADERAAFEQAIDDDAADCGEVGFCDFTRDCDGRYVASGVETAWWAWQARARLAEPTVSATVPDGWSGWACQYPGKLPTLYGARAIAELNQHPEEGQRLIFLTEAAPTPPTSAADAERLDYMEAKRIEARKLHYQWDTWGFDALQSDRTIREQLDAAIAASKETT